MGGSVPTSDWCSPALATRVWDRSPALAWLLDVPPPALLREVAQQVNHRLTKRNDGTFDGWRRQQAER